MAEKIIELPLRIGTWPFTSLKQLTDLTTIKIDSKYQDSLANNTNAVEKILSPLSTLEDQDVFVYCSKEGGVWPGIGKNPDFYESLDKEGYEPFSNPHPSLLIAAMIKLKSKEYSHIRFPKDSTLLLVSDLESAIQNGPYKTFFGIAHSNTDPTLCLISAGGGYGKKITLLLKKKQN